MDEIVMRAKSKWPGTPDVYGWLALDRRGDWLLREEHGRGDSRSRITNAALRAFVARNYAADPRGCWYFQNGPQRVYVQLAYAPLVFRLDGAGADSTLLDHCGRHALAQAAWLDEEGSLVLLTGRGPGLLDDRDLGRVADMLADGALLLGGREIALGEIRSAELPLRFGYVLNPRAE
ncbi:MAG: DUF2946 family protein [Betaproteobacteria bacterium]|nr:DUF2946 family protein [Betaproteobacteria bacterium]